MQVQQSAGETTGPDPNALLHWCQAANIDYDLDEQDPTVEALELHHSLLDYRAACLAAESALVGLTCQTHDAWTDPLPAQVALWEIHTGSGLSICRVLSFVVNCPLLVDCLFVVGCPLVSRLCIGSRLSTGGRLTSCNKLVTGSRLSVCGILCIVKLVE